MGTGPACAQPAGPGAAGTAALPAAVLAGDIRQHSWAQLWAGGVFSPQAVAPLSPGWEAGGLQTPAHQHQLCQGLG